MRKIVTTIILTAVVTAHADNSEITPFPGLKLKDGINIVEFSKLKIPGKELVDEHSLKSKGFIESNENDEEINTLLIIEKESYNEIKAFDAVTNPTDTHLKSSYKKIKLSFVFKELPVTVYPYAYVAAGAYSETKGWDGIVTFFKGLEVGDCSYTTFAIKRAVLEKEKISYEVNNKPTTKSIRGNYKTGFLYSVYWFENDRIKYINCANRAFDRVILNKVVDLAKQID
jgi:hypothetical protein